jgi:hypothetical protein
LTRIRLAVLKSSAAMILVFVGAAASREVAAQAIEGQRTFATSSEAARELVEAARSGEPTRLVPFLGDTAPELISATGVGDSKAILAGFVKAYELKHSLTVEAQGVAYLQVGSGDWPFPFPIVRDGKSWYFDIERGNEEIRDRRIGRNELGAIAVCEAYVQSQLEYAAKAHDSQPKGVYAIRLRSDDGTENGLYWPVSKGAPESPMGPLVADASEGADAAKSPAPEPYHDYFYKILTAQGANAPGGAMDYMVDGELKGGFALIAYPADHGTSAIMTFIVGKDGVVYQKDLGDDTMASASRVTVFDPDESWQVVRP